MRDFFMRKTYFLLCCLMLSFPFANAQKVLIGSESFESNILEYQIIQSQSTTWSQDNAYHVSGTKAIRGQVPNLDGDSTILQIPFGKTFDLSSYSHVMLRFSHICKVDTADECRLEVRDASTVGGKWKTVSFEDYYGDAAYYDVYGFNARSYPIWDATNASAIPDNKTWWKQEIFDLTNYLAYSSQAEFRFVIKKGNKIGSQVNYGWIIDNFELFVSNSRLEIPKVEFISPFVGNKVYSTGPHTVCAKIVSRSSAPIASSYLVYQAETTLGATIIDSVQMIPYQGDSLYSAEIPQFDFGTKVFYYISVYDSLENEGLKISSSYEIVMPPIGAFNGYAYVGDTTKTTTSSYIPYYYNSANTWTRARYFNHEILPDQKAGLITNIAYRVSSSSNKNDNIFIYMKATTDTSFFGSKKYVDPISDGATLVWSGTCQPPKGWFDIELHNPFLLPAGHHLIVYVNNSAGKTGNGSVTWYVDVPNTSAFYKTGTSFLATETGTAVNRPQTRFLFQGYSSDSNSVALEKIASPTVSNTIVGTSIPITAVIRNKGLENLTSCKISYAINGVFQKDTLWTGTCLPDFNETITLGDYIPLTVGKDTITVWVSLPNGENDNNVSDDTLSKYIDICGAAIGGDVAIGSTRTYTSLVDFINTIRLCTPISDVRILLDSGIYIIDSLSLINIADVIDNHHLTITSATGNPEDVVLMSDTTLVKNPQAFILLNNTNNITFEAITIDVSQTPISGIKFFGNCENVTINNCIIKATPSINTTTVGAIFKGSSTGVVNNLTITNNIIDGGYGCIYLYPGTTSSYGKNIRIENNVVTSPYLYGIHIQYAQGVKVIGNKSFSADTSFATSAAWRGLYFSNAEIDICNGNHCQQLKNNANTVAYGIYATIVNKDMGSPYALFSNNEIILNPNKPREVHGIYINSGKVELVHNTILMLNDTIGSGIYLANSADAYLRASNNNVLVPNEYGFPINIVGVKATYESDFNNYYSRKYFGKYENLSYEDKSDWVVITSSDEHSVSVNTPLLDSNKSFLDTSYTLELTSYDGITTLRSSKVLKDIQNVDRDIATAMGCYKGISAYQKDLYVSHITPLRNGSIIGETDSLFLTITNMGLDNITSGTFNWSINGVAQTPATWNGNLLSGESATFFLGEITYIVGQISVAAWFSVDVNTWNDNNSKNDTIFVKTLTCPAMGGLITIGNGGDYASIEELFGMINFCSLSSDLIVAYESGMYSQNFNFDGLLNTGIGNHSITFTSLANNKDSVIILQKEIPTAQTAPFMLKNVNNISFKHLTLSGYSSNDAGEVYKYSTAIIIGDSCSNIEIDSCKLMVIDTSIALNSSNFSSIYVKISNAISSNIRITNNDISGGSYGMYVYGSSSKRIDSILIANNNIHDIDARGMHIYYVSNIQVSNNFISQRVTPFVQTPMYAIYCNYVTGEVIGNKIVGENLKYGIYLASFNSGDTILPPLVANNEIIGYDSKDTYSFGIYCDASTSTRVYHNSIYLSSSEEPANLRAMVITPPSSSQIVDVQNNIFVVNGIGNQSSAIQLTNTTAANLQKVYINNNVYHCQQNGFLRATGAYTSAATERTLAQWNGYIPSDIGSVEIMPPFVNKTTLKLADSLGITCPYLSSVPYDKDSTIRDTNLTVRGAYHYRPAQINIAPIAILGLNAIENSGKTSTIKVLLENRGLSAISSVNIVLNYNGTTISTTPWTGTLNSRDTISVDLQGDITIVSGTNTITIITNSPNGGIDEFVYDDTLSLEVFGCSGAYSGTYTIGTGGDFHSINDALSSVSSCGIDGDITFNILPGTYDEIISIDNSINTRNNQTYAITFTSATGDSSDVKIVSSNITFTLDNARAIYLKNLTIEGSINAILLKGTCRDIDIRNCCITTDTISTNNTIRTIYYNNTSSTNHYLENIRIANNTIVGGYYNIYIYYGHTSVTNLTNSTKPCVSIDSNILLNGYSGGIYTYYYCHINSISHNIIQTRGVSTTQYGIYSYYNKIDKGIINNKILLRGSSTSYGLDLYYVNNSYGNTSNALIANNEIIKNNTGTGITYGIYLVSSDVNIYHNSVLLIGTSTKYALQMSSMTSNKAEIKNNIFATKSSNATSTSYAIYATNSANLKNVVLDYNNYYSTSKNFAYVSKAISEIAILRDSTSQDEHSICIDPNFVYPDTNLLDLSVNENHLLLVPFINEVPFDINGVAHDSNFAVMGAYEYIALDTDVIMVDIVDFDMLSTGTNEIKVSIANIGATPIDTVTIYFEINGVISSVGYRFVSPLQQYQQGIVSLGTFNLPLGPNTIKAYISVTGDKYPENDTIFKQRNICNRILNGEYIVGNSSTADFKSWSDFVNDLTSCGLSGDITLKFESGVYTDTISFFNLNSLMNNYKLTITSLDNDKDSVIFLGNASILGIFTLGATSNLEIKHITIDASNNRYGINIVEETNNISITNCKFIAKDTNSSSYYCIYKPSSCSIDSVTIKNCEFYYGYYGISFSGSSTMKSSNCIVDSNYFYNVYAYPLYLYYLSQSIVSNNTIISKLPQYSPATYYGMYIYYTENVHFINNHIFIDNKNVSSTVNGINYSSGNNDIIVNNEIYINTNANTIRGIYVYGPNKTNVLHNSVYITGSSTTNSQGLYCNYTTGAANSVTIRKNLLVNDNTVSTKAYAIYINGAYSSNNDTNYRINDNGYSSSGNIGYVSSDKLTLEDWQSVVLTDSNSKVVNVQFTDVTKDLTLKSYEKVITSLDSNVLTDITGKTRTAITAYGAYQPNFYQLDASLLEFVYNPIVINQANAISVKFANMGVDILTNMTLNWTYNGVAQPAVNWSGNLSLGNTDVIKLGDVTQTHAGYVNIEVWISAVNNSNDMNNNDDTLSISEIVCNGPLAGGYYIVGTSSSATYQDEKEVFDVLNSCGINGNVTFAFENGVYDRLFFSDSIPGTSDSAIITITSVSGNANDVQFIGERALYLNNTGYFRFNNITIGSEDSTITTIAVNMNSQITNVEFYGCNIKLSPYAVRSIYRGISYDQTTSSTTSLNNVRFIKNNISGGYANIYLNYAGGSLDNLKTNTCYISIDSNNLTEAYYYGLYANYNAIYNSISYNNVKTRLTKNVTSVQYGMYISYSIVHNGIVGNKVLIQGCRSTTGIYIASLNDVTRMTTSHKNGLIANNEIRKLVKAENDGVTATGMNVLTNSCADIYHNSIYIQDTCSVRALQITTSKTGNLSIKNNILSVKSTKRSTCYALYIDSNYYNTTIDYNNYYNFNTNDNLAYIGKARTSLADIRSVGDNNNSVNLLTYFVDINTNLELMTASNMAAPNVGINVDINGLQRDSITCMGAYNANISSIVDLSLKAVIGFPQSGDICSPDYASIDYVINNNGSEIIDFSTTPLSLTLSVKGVKQFDTTIIINKGELGFLKVDTFNVMSALDIRNVGTYDITSWLTLNGDNESSNDSIFASYTTNKVALPIDEDFTNGIPNSMYAVAEQGTTTWEIIYDSNATGTILPQYGNGMLMFDGNNGDMTRLFTRQIDLNGSSEPVLDFWYYHDTATTASNDDYTDVRLTFDGGQNFKTLHSIRKKNGTDMGWKQYTFRLDSFINEACIIIVFEAMRKSNNQYDGTQYIDRIRLTSNQDIAISGIEVSPISICDHKGKSLSVTLEATTAEGINFEKYPTALLVEITGQTTKSYSVTLDTGILVGFGSLKIELDNNFDFDFGTYYIKAYLSTPIDRNPLNDELLDTIIINPNVDIALKQTTGGSSNTNCIPVGTKVTQEVSFTNDGNLEIEDMVLKLQVYNASGVKVEEIVETITGKLEVDSTINYTFTQTYTVPNDEQYNVMVMVSPVCDSTIVYQSFVNECVDLNDIEIVSIINPDANSSNCSKVGETQKVEVKIRNNSPTEDAKNKELAAIISDANGKELGNWKVTLDDIGISEEVTYEFPYTFVVPNTNTYKVLVYFVGNNDLNSSNDTSMVEKCTDLSIEDLVLNTISMKQNVPNPAKGSTIVNYTLPSAGKVQFQIVSITGQILYKEEKDSQAGKNTIEFDVTNLSSGIYFYTMTFKGQKLVKKMTIE